MTRTVLTVAVAATVALGLVPAIAIAVDARRQALPCAEVPGVPQPFEGDEHLPRDGAPHRPYRTVPPTSGPHSPKVFAPGVYRRPVAAEMQVHFLEHGHVLIQYPPATPAAEVAVLERVARRHPRTAAVAPNPEVLQGIALTAWQRLHRLPHADAGTIEAFIETFIEKVSGRYAHGWQDGAGDCV